MAKAGERVAHTIGETSYGFRAPDLYDPAKARRALAKQRIRRPSQFEFQVAGLRGIEEIARSAGEEDEGARQRALLERWYELLEPVKEDDIDEPDPMERGKKLLAKETERRAELAKMHPDVMAIEASLERHWPPYAELKADREFWDDVSRIEIVRLLLQDRDGTLLPRDDEGWLTEAAYRSLPREHTMPLATFAFNLLSPSEAQRKN